MNKVIPEKYSQLVEAVKQKGLSGLTGQARSFDENRIFIRTYYPGCTICLSIVDENWNIELTNRDPDKISSQTIHAIFSEQLKPFPASDYRIIKGHDSDFLHDSVCLENWRDIYRGRIDELVADQSLNYKEAKIGAFGFLKGSTKPKRGLFIDLANQHPTILRYVETQKYLEQHKPTISLLDYKHQFKYIIDLPGHTYSTKLYWMLFMKRPLFIVQPNLPFAWEKQLQPWVHYMPVKRDFSDLIERFEWAESHPDEVEAMRLRLFGFATNELPPTKVLNNFSQFLDKRLQHL